MIYCSLCVRKRLRNELCILTLYTYPVKQQLTLLVQNIFSVTKSYNLITQQIPILRECNLSISCIQIYRMSIYFILTTQYSQSFLDWKTHSIRNNTELKNYGCNIKKINKFV